MGKYKNGFAVKGPKTLLEAFAKELKVLGYVESNSALSLKDDEGLRVYGFNGSVQAQSCYLFYDSTTSKVYESGQAIYYLPEHWNEALAAASEPYERPFQVGDWIKWDTGDFYRLVEGNYEFLLESWKIKDKFCYFRTELEYSQKEIKDCARLATKEEIYEHLVKVATEMYGENPVISLRKHTYDGENWGSEFTSSTTCGANVRLFEFTYDENFDSLSTRGAGLAIVYEKGKWAEKSILLPKIEGYTGKVVGDRVMYGCKSFHKEEVKKLYASIKHFNQNLNGKITSVALDDEYIIRFSDLEQIVNTL